VAECPMPEAHELWENFPWESTIQRNAYFSFVKWLRDTNWRDRNMVVPHDLSLIFMLQKMHEANEWLLKLIADQTDSWRTSVEILTKRIDALEQQARYVPPQS